MGASFTVDGETGAVVVEGAIAWNIPDLELNVGNSGTTLRLLLGLATLGKHPLVLTGDESLKRRPNGMLIKALQTLGAEIESDQGRAPLRVNGPIRGGTTTLPAGQSSQYASAVFLALAQVGTASRLVLNTPIHSLPYFQLTMDMARAFGNHFDVQRSDDALSIDLKGNGFTSPSQWLVEGDWSSASFLLVAAWGSGRSIELDELSSTSTQADRAIQSVLERLGSTFEWSTPTRVRFVPGTQGRVEHIDVQASPDLFPILCTMAACLEYPVRIDGAPNLRHKESDRISLMSNGLTALGVGCTPLHDGLIVGTGRLHSGVVGTEHDHCIQMSFRVLSRLADLTIELDGHGSELVSYPNFESHLSALFDEADND